MATKVLWITNGLAPGGAERLLCAAAEAHDQHRFDLSCAFVNPSLDQLAEDLSQRGVSVTCLGVRRHDPGWPIRLWCLVRQGGWDVVHIHSPLPGAIARLATRSMRTQSRPLLVTTEHTRPSTYRAPTRMLTALTGRWDDAIIGVTGDAVSGRTIHPDQTALHLIHGINTSQTSVSSTEAPDVRHEFGIPKRSFLIGTIANFRQQKDYPNLLRAFRRVVDQGLEAQLIAVGHGPEEQAMRMLRSELGLEEEVTFTGLRHDAIRILQACDAFVLSSQWEGLPVAAMEAAALGLPIVCTAVGGLAEEFTNESTALLVPPQDSRALADALTRVIGDPHLRNTLGSGALVKSKDFDATRAVRAIETLYERGPAPKAREEVIPD